MKRYCKLKDTLIELIEYYDCGTCGNKCKTVKIIEKRMNNYNIVYDMNSLHQELIDEYNQKLKQKLRTKKLNRILE